MIAKFKASYVLYEKEKHVLLNIWMKPGRTTLGPVLYNTIYDQVQ